MPNFATLVAVLELACKDRAQLVLENAALRHQLAVLKRSVTRPRIEDSDRIFWIMLRRVLKEWREALFFVKPDTITRWHRRGFKYYWKKRSKSKPGRPPIGMDVIMLIKRMSRDNATWSARRISDELAVLGHAVGETTVAKYMVRSRGSDREQTWTTFLRNHMAVTAACDFFVVPTLTFKLLYCFVVLSHNRRRILHINVTSHPTAAWTARQLVEAFPFTAPRFLIRDGDGIYGWEFISKVRALGIKSMRIAPRSPWQNPFAERVIGTIRRECVDHIIPLGESHLRRVLTEYVEYYNESRTHQSLDGDAPVPRETQAVGQITAKPVLGGLHHVYSRAA